MSDRPNMYKGIGPDGRRYSVFALNPKIAGDAFDEMDLARPANLPPQIASAPWLIRDPAIASTYVASNGAIIWEA
jgi:hypothetical protein